MAKIGLRMDPNKGFHHKKGAYVEVVDSSKQHAKQNTHAYMHPEAFSNLKFGFQFDFYFSQYHGKMDMANREKVLSQLQMTVKTLISDDIPTSVEYKNIDSAHQDTRVRIIGVGGAEKCPCGGTHVKKTGEIGHMTITKIKNIKGKFTRISYDLSV